MKSLPFAILSGIVFGIYSVGCMVFNEPFWALTSCCAGILITIYPLYFEQQRIDVMGDAQVAQYLAGALPSHHNFVFREHLRHIKSQLHAISSNRLPLTAGQLQVYLEERLADRQTQQSPAHYWVTHIVDSVPAATVWQERETSYPWLRVYVDRQRALLDAGGEVARIFLVGARFAHEHGDVCQAMFQCHEQLFKGTRTAVKTLVVVLPEEEIPRYEVAILDGVELFMWDRASPVERTRASFRRGEYNITQANVQEEMILWRRYLQNARPPEQLAELIASARPA